MDYNYSMGYRSDAELAAVKLFEGYPEALLQFAVACCVIFILIGIPGNLITIIALGSCKKFRNATAIFIINLHMNNLIFCCVIIPMTSVTYSIRYWRFGSTMCRVYSLTKYALNATALLTVVAITVNRYVMVCHPLMYQRFYKKKTLILLVISTWVFGFTLFLPTFFGVWGQYGLETKGLDCTMIPDINNVCPKVFFVCFAFAGPYLIIAVCYGRIWWTVRKKMKKSRNYNAKAIQPTTSTSELEISVAENGETSVHINSPHDDKINSSINCNPAGRENKMTKFFKSSLRFTKKEERLLLPTRKDKKLASMIIAILISFAICYLPLAMTRVFYKGYKSEPFSYILSHLLEYSAAFISPIIYVIMSNEYRQAYKILFENLKCKPTVLWNL